jgi:hypothetical protein
MHECSYVLVCVDNENAQAFRAKQHAIAAPRTTAPDGTFLGHGEF